MAENNIKDRVLRRKSDFENLKRTGRRSAPTNWMVVSYQKNTLGYFRFGLTISGKVGNSVLRNRLKRWCREYFRGHKDQVSVVESDQGMDVNVIFKPVSVEFYKQLQHEQVKDALAAFFRRLQKAR